MVTCRYKSNVLCITSDLPHSTDPYCCPISTSDPSPSLLPSEFSSFSFPSSKPCPSFFKYFRIIFSRLLINQLFTCTKSIPLSFAKFCRSFYDGYGLKKFDVSHFYNITVDFAAILQFFAFVRCFSWTYSSYSISTSLSVFNARFIVYVQLLLT